MLVSARPERLYGIKSQVQIEWQNTGLAAYRLPPRPSHLSLTGCAHTYSTEATGMTTPRQAFTWVLMAVMQSGTRRINK